MKVFIDTNIFLDTLLKREPFKHSAEKLLNLCDEGVFSAFTSCVSFINVTYFLQRFNKTAYTESLEKILNTISIIPLENKDFKKAIAFGFSDTEDAYQYAAALKVKDIEYIITRNIRDFNKSSIPAISAKDFLVQYASSL
jgi:predicted nucleic acid-binding protein